MDDGTGETGVKFTVNVTTGDTTPPAGNDGNKGNNTGDDNTPVDNHVPDIASDTEPFFVSGRYTIMLVDTPKHRNYIVISHS